MNKLKLIGISAIVVGILQILNQLNSIFFIQYFSDIGDLSRIGIILLYLILTIAGIFLLKQNKISVKIFRIFFVGIVIERLTMYFLFGEYYVVLVEIASHILIGFVFIIMIFILELKKFI